MNYNKAKVGGKPSASQWNGLLDMHRKAFAGNASNGPIPPALQNSVIASATLRDDSDDIGPYKIVRIMKVSTLANPGLNAPSN